MLVLSCDGKGIVMRPGSLRATTAKAAASSTPKLATRLSEGEKRGRKRMAEVGAVYEVTPISHCPADALPCDDTQRAAATAGPDAHNKWLTAGFVDDAATVVAAIFDEADRRDPGLLGAEAVRRLRALRSNGDFDNYWTWHLAQERRRVHQSRYLDGALPRAALTSLKKSRTRVISGRTGRSGANRTALPDLQPGVSATASRR